MPASPPSPTEGELGDATGQRTPPGERVHGD